MCRPHGFAPGTMPHVPGGTFSLVWSLAPGDFLIPLLLYPVVHILHPLSTALALHPVPDPSLSSSPLDAWVLPSEEGSHVAA